MVAAGADTLDIGGESTRAPAVRFRARIRKIARTAPVIGAALRGAGLHTPELYRQRASPLWQSCG